MLSFLAENSPNIIGPESLMSVGVVISVVVATAFIVKKLSKIEHSILVAQHAAKAANQRTIGLLRVIRGLINGLNLDKAQKDEMHREIDSLLIPIRSHDDVDTENGD